MLQGHFAFCQPTLPENESGFLKLGHLPKENVVDFRMILRIIGSSDLSRKYQTSWEKPFQPFFRAPADDVDAFSSKFEDRIFSQDSFCDINSKHHSINGAPNTPPLKKEKETDAPSL